MNVLNWKLNLSLVGNSAFIGPATRGQLESVVPVSSSIADSYSWVRGVEIPALFAASKYEIPSFPFQLQDRALAIAKQASFRLGFTRANR
jgi:hypothetical protein